MIEKLYRGYGMRIHTDDIDPAETIGAITQFSIPDDVQIEREILDGGIFPSQTSLLGHKEKMELTSLNVDKVVDIIGPVGLCARGLSGQSGVEFFLSQIDQCTPGVNPGAVNVRLASKSLDAVVSQKFGLFHPTQLIANHAAQATFGFCFIPSAPTGLASIAVSTGIALPTIADAGTRFGLAPEFAINGVNIRAKKSVNINFNVGLLEESADGALAPEWVSIESQLAMITITGVNPEWAAAANIPRDGKSFAHANFEFYLRKRLAGSSTGYHANNQLQHIKITAAGKAFVTNLASGQGNRPTETAIVCYVEFDGTNSPIVMNTLQEIT